MAERQRIFRYALESGESVAVAGMRVTPLARVLELRWRGGAVVWNRPVGLAVEQDGQVTQMPIPDVTRMVQVVLALFAALLSMLTFAQAATERRRRHE